MKKFILISSLLAAGTLGASAGETITLKTNLFSPTTSSATFANNFIYQRWTTGYTATDTEGGDIFGSDPRKAAIFNYFNTISQDTWYYGTANASEPGDSAYKPVVSNGQITKLVNCAKGELGLGAWTTLDLSGVTDLSLTYSASFTSESESDVVSLAVFAYNSSDSSSVTRLASTSLVSSSEVQTVSLATDLSSFSSDTRFVVVLRGTAKRYQPVTISNLSFIGTAIPEPSMFGLLAGTLALGLAGTRRRAGTQK